MTNKLGIFLILFLFASQLAVFQLVPNVKANPDWLSGWQYRKSHEIYNATGAGTNYQVRIKTHYYSGYIDNVTFVSRSDNVSASQGVCSDGTYLYTVIGGSGVSESHIKKWDKSWNLQQDKTVPDDSYGTDEKQLNSLCYKDGKLYIGANNYPNSPEHGWIFVYNASDLSYIEKHQVKNYHCEGCDYHDGYWWVVYHDWSYVSKYDSDWNWVADYALESGGQYQGIRWKGDYIYVNNHEGASRTKLDCYRWTGSGFELVKEIDRPSQWCTQGISFDPSESNVMWWAERGYNGTALDDRVVKTTINMVSDSGEDVYLNEKCRTDFGDIRFTDDDGVTLLDYWMEEKVDSNYAVFWVKILDDLSSSNVTIYIYYGKSDATTASNGTNTFLAYNDFENGVGDFVNSYGTSTTEESSLDYAHSGEKSLKVKGSNGGFYTNNGTFWQTSKQAIGFWMYLPTGESTYGDFFFIAQKSGDDVKRAEVLIWSDGSLYVRDNTSQVQIKSGNYKDQWIKWEAKLDKDGGTVKYYVYDSSLTLLASKTDATLEDVTKTYRDLLLYAYDGKYVYIDDVYSRKYVDPEPSHGSWGSEEEEEESPPSVWDDSAATGIWYMRSDSHTANNITGYKLSETQSATAESDSRSKTGTFTIYYGVRVWVVFSDGQTEELTSGTPIATVYRNTLSSGLQSANWTCPGYSSIIDAVMVKVYQRFSDEAEWNLRVTFITYNQTLIKLPESTWTFYYYTKRAVAGDTTATFYWGNSTYNSRVRFQYYEPNAWELMMYHLSQGDFVSFIVWPYFNLIGNLFYGVLLLVVGATLYRRYESFVPIAIMMVLFGGAGGVVTMLVPAAGLHLAWLFMAFGLAILFFKLVRAAGR